ncbi:hypothetical protein ACQW5G_05415 [Fructilactobacillus sp. Tb1]|uniref:hypothetical protein n=1 Tax=Fructilactobacillus sp. Tb1 TaxID=3422304 RepID=UPI003D2AFA1E
MTMEESENTNTIIRNRKELNPLVGKRIKFIGYLCSFNKNKYGDTDKYPYVALLIDVFNLEYKINLEHLHIQLTNANYQKLKSRNDLFIGFVGTVYMYEARVKKTFKNKYQQTEFRVLREDRTGFDDVEIDNMDINDTLAEINTDYESSLTTYEDFVLGQNIVELTSAGVQTVSKRVIISRLLQEKSVLERDQMLRRMQRKLHNGTFTDADIPDIFTRENTIDEDVLQRVLEENKRQKHKLRIDRELNILKSLHKDLEIRFEKEQAKNVQLAQEIKRANGRTDKVRDTYKRTNDQYKAVLADSDLKLWNFLKVYAEYRWIKFKNLFKKHDKQKQSPQKADHHESISAEDLQKLKDKLEG